MEKEPTQEIMQFVAESLKGTKDFVLDQAPDVIQQYLGALFVEHLILAIVLFVILVSLLSISGFIVLRILKKRKENKYYIGPDNMDIFLGSFVLTVILSFVTTPLVTNMVEAYKIKLYPKGYLMQQVLEK